MDIDSLIIRIETCNIWEIFVEGGELIVYIILWLLWLSQHDVILGARDRILAIILLQHILCLEILYTTYEMFFQITNMSDSDTQINGWGFLRVHDSVWFPKLIWWYPQFHLVFITYNIVGYQIKSSCISPIYSILFIFSQK